MEHGQEKKVNGLSILKEPNNLSIRYKDDLNNILNQQNGVQNLTFKPYLQWTLNIEICTTESLVLMFQSSFLIWLKWTWLCSIALLQTSW